MDVDEALAVADDLENYDSADYPKATAVLGHEVRKLRARVDELRPMAAHGVRNPPEVIEELVAIRQRARDVRLGGDTPEQVRAALYILGEPT